MKQENPEKLARSREILQALKEARGGTLLDSHRQMGNDPHLAQMFLNQYQANAPDTTICCKYRELIVMAIGMATGTTTTYMPVMKLAWFVSSTPSSTSATSLRRTGAPLRHATTILAKSSALISEPLSLMMRSYCAHS